MRYLTTIPILLLASSVFAADCTETISQGSTNLCDAIIKDNIKWSLSAERQVGQFVSGGFFVVVPTGSITITMSTVSGTLGGSMKNIEPKSDIYESPTYVTGAGQGYATGAPSYNSNLNIGSSEVVEAGDMVVTTTKRTPDTSQTHIDEAAILTVLATAPAAESFRPGYADASRTIYSADDIDYDLLADLTQVGSAPSLSVVADMVARPWIDHVHHYYDRYIHPHNNMREYGGQIASDTSIIGVMLNSDFSDAEKKPIAVGFIQIGLDIASVQDSQGGQMFRAKVSHKIGRKLPYFVAGHLLDISSIKSMPYSFASDDTTRYITAQDVTDSEGGSSSPYLPDQNYTTAMIGMPEWGHYWYDRGTWTADWTADNYRTCCSMGTMDGTALAVVAMDLKEEWDHDPFFDYNKRYVAISNGVDDGWTVNNESAGGRGKYSSGWAVTMYDEYFSGLDDPVTKGHFKRTGGNVLLLSDGSFLTGAD